MDFEMGQCGDGERLECRDPRRVCERGQGLARVGQAHLPARGVCQAGAVEADFEAAGQGGEAPGAQGQVEGQRRSLAGAGDQPLVVRGFLRGQDGDGARRVEVAGSPRARW